MSEPDHCAQSISISPFGFDQRLGESLEDPGSQSRVELLISGHLRGEERAGELPNLKLELECGGRGK